jgi:hypothetical protein
MGTPALSGMKEKTWCYGITELWGRNIQEFLNIKETEKSSSR